MFSVPLFVYCVFVNCSIHVLQFLCKMIASLQLTLSHLGGVNHIRKSTMLLSQLNYHNNYTSELFYIIIIIIITQISHFSALARK